jgi:heat shock protein HslJ
LSTGFAACGEAIDAQERMYLNAIQSAVTYEFSIDTLIFRDGSGQETARFTRIG